MICLVSDTGHAIESVGEFAGGTRSECFRSGFGAALHQQINDDEAFIKKFRAPYAPFAAQKLWYEDSAPPEGYQPAALSQARLRGFGAGGATLARKLQGKHRQRGHSYCRRLRRSAILTRSMIWESPARIDAIEN